MARWRRHPETNEGDHRGREGTAQPTRASAAANTAISAGVNAAASAKWIYPRLAHSKHPVDHATVKHVFRVGGVRVYEAHMIEQVVARLQGGAGALGRALHLL